MAFPLTAGLRLATAIAKRVGKKLVKTSSYGGKGKYKYATAKRSLYKAHKITSKKTIRGIKPAVIGAKRHLKFYSKVIAPGGTAPNKFATARGLKHLITRPTFGQKKWIKPIRNYRKESGGLSAPLGHPAEKKRMGMYTGYYYDRLSGQRSKRLKRTAIGGLIGYKVFGNGD